MEPIFVITTFDPDGCFDDSPKVLGYCKSQEQGYTIINQALDIQCAWNKTNRERNKWISKIHATQSYNNTLGSGSSHTVIGFSKETYLESIASITDLPEQYKKEFTETVEAGYCLAWVKESNQEFFCFPIESLEELPIVFSNPGKFRQIYKGMPPISY